MVHPRRNPLMRYRKSVQAVGCHHFGRLQLSRRETLRRGCARPGGPGFAGFVAGEEARKSQRPERVWTGEVVHPDLHVGRPSQLDTWDPKPDAPEDIRGPFRPIATNVPGISISEHFPLLAQQAHRLSIVRSMNHNDAAHLSTAHRFLTGHLAPTPNSDAAGPSPRDWPHLGAIVSKLRPTAGAVPALSICRGRSCTPPPPAAGHPARTPAGWARHYDPFHVEGDPNDSGYHVEGLGLPDGISPARRLFAASLLEQLADTAELSGNGPQSWDGYQQNALDSLVSAEARGAFEIDREDPRLRDRYGRHIHGQCLLLARRLIEAGVGLVTVNWHNDGQFFWDTHGNNFNQLKHRLMPPADQGLAALLEDLDCRGLLDETLVVWVGEFGRTPRINKANSGREHWPHCYSAVLAGAGVRGGTIYGASDRWAAYPARDPVSPEDLGATILHALGIEPATMVEDALDRPLRINDGTPLVTLFG